jgi:hypothetical protein
MFVEQLIKKIEESMIFGFVEERICVFFSAGCLPLLSFFLYAKKP